MTGDPGRSVAVVTGGAGGIGAAIAEALGARGTHVVTMDPVVSLDGSERLPEPVETTAQRIVAAGGSAQSSAASVTDAYAVRDLFEQLVQTHGGVDAVVNVAGISRPTGYAKGAEQDWIDVIDVHLNGYLTILRAALPHMATAGRGRVLGVTSGSGWRAADTGAYGCAKRAVASLTWQLGAAPPVGVRVNALSPIAATRMVTAALGRRRPPAAAGMSTAAPSPSSGTGGLSLGTMPAPAELGPIGAHLLGEDFGWCSGQVLFSGGSEVAVIEPPSLLEVVRTAGVTSLPHALRSVTAPALVTAEQNQSSSGGGNSRFGPIFDDAPTEAVDPAIRSCVLAIEDPALEPAVAGALRDRGVTCTVVRDPGAAIDFGAAAEALRQVTDDGGPPDAVVVAIGAVTVAGRGEPWERILAEHRGIADQIRADAAWARAAADLAGSTGRPIRLLTVVDASGAGGRSRAQAVSQLSRSAVSATDGGVAHFAVSVEVPTLADEARPIAELAAHLLCSAETMALSGAELVAGPGWCGLRGHPRPAGSITFGGPRVPGWVDAALREIVMPRTAPIDGRREGPA